MRRMLRGRLIIGIALLLLAAGGAATVAFQTVWAPMSITAYFTSATSVYPGDDVRVLGVKVGTIDSIVAEGTQAKVTMKVNRKTSVPADAKAVIVSQNLIAARYIQLTPAYVKGPKMAQGAVIPVQRTAVPVEWNEVKTQLMRLATELGPKDSTSGTPAGRFIESAADAMDGNSIKLRQTLAELSGTGRILAEGSGDIVGTLKNLNLFVSALRNSNDQIVLFQDRLATLTSVIDSSRSDLDRALENLSTAVVDIKRFIAGSHDQTSEQIQRLANVTQNLVDHRLDIENILHVAPTAFANAYNIYNPNSGTAVGSFAFQTFANPVTLICSGIGAVENATAPEAAKLCAQYLSPAMRLINLNYLPFPVNPLLDRTPPPDRILYSPPSLAAEKGGTPVDPVEPPPAVSAYTGMAGDIPPPPGYGPPPGPPIAARAPSLPEMLLPAEAPPGQQAPQAVGGPTSDQPAAGPMP